MRLIRVVLCGLLGMVLSGCKSVYTEFNPKTDFSMYRTFAWVPSEAACDSDDAKMVPALLTYAREQAMKQLEKKGLMVVPVESADLVGCVQIKTGLYGDPEAGGGEPRSQKVGGVTLASLSDSWMPEEETALSLEQGTLYLKIWDRKKDVMVWQGWVERVIDLDQMIQAEDKVETQAAATPPAFAREVVDRAIKSLAEKLPAMGGR